MSFFKEFHHTVLDMYKKPENALQVADRKPSFGGMSFFKEFYLTAK